MHSHDFIILVFKDDNVLHGIDVELQLLCLMYYVLEQQNVVTDNTECASATEVDSAVTDDKLMQQSF